VLRKTNPRLGPRFHTLSQVMPNRPKQGRRAELSAGVDGAKGAVLESPRQRAEARQREACLVPLDVDPRSLG